MILGYNSLCQLVESGIIENVDPANINGASIDLTLGNTISVETAHENIIFSHYVSGLPVYKVNTKEILK